MTGKLTTGKRRKRRGLLLASFIVLAGTALGARDIRAGLEDMWTEWKRREIRQYGTAQAGAGAPTPVEYDNAEFMASLGVWEIERPVERTEKEVLRRLEELGQASPVIEQIYGNHSLYPEELLAVLANNPEMADFVFGYPGAESAAGEITPTEKEQEFPLFLQWDPRWGYKPYGESCIGLAGCGPTCLSMVLFYLTGDEELTPDRIAAYSMENGYYVEGTGTAWALMEDVPRLYGVEATTIGLDEGKMEAVLDAGGIIVCAVRKGDFTLSGHFIVIYGRDEEGFLVNDPNSLARSGKRWTFRELQGQIKNIWAYEKGSM